MGASPQSLGFRAVQLSPALLRDIDALNARSRPDAIRSLLLRIDRATARNRLRSLNMPSEHIDRILDALFPS